MSSVAKSEEVVTVTPGGTSIGERNYVHRVGIWHLCAHLLCVSGDAVYLQRRKRNRHRNPDRWTSTVSGHVTVNDATANGEMTAGEEAGRKALEHETLEELGFSLPIHERAVFIGDVAARSEGGGEICNCTALVFTLNYDELIERVSTVEVEEIAAFPISEVQSALQSHGRLGGSDRQLHVLADNFLPVFELFLQWRRTDTGTNTSAALQF